MTKLSSVQRRRRKLIGLTFSVIATNIQVVLVARLHKIVIEIYLSSKPLFLLTTNRPILSLETKFKVSNRLGEPPFLIFCHQQRIQYLPPHRYFQNQTKT